MKWLDGIIGLSGQEFDQTLRDSEGQGSLVCCSPWGHKESDTTDLETEQQHSYVMTCLTEPYPSA